MDSQKISNLVSNFLQAATLLVTIAMLGFMVYVRIYPDPDRAPTIEGKFLMRSLVSGYGWGPPIVVGVMLLLMLIFRGVKARKVAKLESRIENNPNKASLEIISPFDGEQVGLYETVRGRVFPPDSDLQVLVFAGDKKWYPQRTAEVNGSIWSVKCQFGNADSDASGGGAYKIVAISGSELKQGMWYADLPNGTKSRIIHVHRHDVTIEQKLAAALKEAKDANLRANEQRGTNESLLELYRESQRKLADLDWLRRLAEEQAQNIADHVKVMLITYPHSGELVLSGTHLCATVGLSIRNESVFDITISPKDVAGNFWMNDRALAEPVGLLIDDFRGSIEDLKPMKTEVLVLKQALRQSDAEEINKRLGDKDAKFWIGNLRITVSVNNSPVSVQSKPLRLIEVGNVLLSSLKCNTKTLDKE